MSNSTRVKINLRSGEIEFEGSEEFVQRQLDNLELLLEIIDPSGDDGSGYVASEEQGEGGGDEAATDELAVPGTFGEWLHRFPRHINDTDRALVAAYYIQHNSNENEFRTREVTQILRENGIRLANTSETIKRIVDSRRAFRVRGSGRTRYFRVSRDGEEYLRSILQ